MKDGRAREEWKDSELTARIQRGETEYLDLLIERHYDGIFRFCLCKTGNREAAYDCARFLNETGKEEQRLWNCA